MRLATLRTDDGTAAAVVSGDEWAFLPYPDVGALLADGDIVEVDLAGVGVLSTPIHIESQTQSGAHAPAATGGNA
ncbi:hypothetical protein [Saccharopolyspora sp. NPDC002376]